MGTETIVEPIDDGMDIAGSPHTHAVSTLDVLAILAARRRFIGRCLIAAAGIATIVAFLLPVRYEGSSVVLPPQQSSSVGSMLLGELSSGGGPGSGGGLGSLAPLASRAGSSLGLKNPSEMYVALLTSRSVEDALIHRFDLMAEYREKRLSDARKELEKRTTAVAGAKDGLIRITVEDRDPHRAADLANGYVEEFRKVTATLAISEAQRRRLFFEQQLRQAKDDLTVAEEEMKKTQESTGVLQIESQARSLIESAAVLRGQVAAKQVQIESMRTFAAEDNPGLKLAKQQLAALQAQLARLAGSQPDNGTDINLSKGRVTGSELEYLRRLRDFKYNETVFELLAKQFEVAKLDEAREGSIVQVVDLAVPADKRSSPHRLLIVISTIITVFFVAAFGVVFQERWKRSRDFPEKQRRIEAIWKNWRNQSPAFDRD